MASFLRESLNRAHDRFNRSTKLSVPARKGVNPFQSVFGGGGGVWDNETRYQTVMDAAEEQSLHYRGRVQSASIVGINRIIRQPVMIARRLGISDGDFSPQRYRKEQADAYRRGTLLSQKVRSGEIDPSTVPSWICKAPSHSENLEILENHRMLRVIRKPNMLMTRTHLWQATLGCLDATGVAYWVIDTDPDMILPVPSTWVKPVPSENGLGWDHFEIHPPGSLADPQIIAPENMTRFYYVDPFDPFGQQSPIQANARAILADESIDEAQDQSFRNAMKPTFTVTAGDETGRLVRLEPHQRAEILSWLRREMAGAVRHGLPIIKDAWLKEVEPLFANPSEMDFLESSKRTKANIYEAYQTSPIVAGMVEGANRAGSAVAEFNFVANRVNPIACMVSETITEDVLPMFANDGEDLLFWIEEAKPHDPEHIRNLWRDGEAIGAVELDEVRQKTLGLPPLPNNQGRYRVIPSSRVLLDDEGEIISLTGDAMDSEDPLEDDPALEEVEPEGYEETPPEDIED